MHPYHLILCVILKTLAITKNFHLPAVAIGFIASFIKLVLAAFKKNEDENGFLPQSIVLAGFCSALILSATLFLWHKCDSNDSKYPDEEDEEVYGNPTPVKIPIYYKNGKWYSTPTINNKKNTKLDKETPMIVRFRGINLPAKTPSLPPQLKSTHESLEFYSSKASVSFVDRPLPLATASKHLQRLSTSHQLGFNLLRLSVSWEAVMHEGPGIIDHHYLNYLSDLVDKAAQYGFYILIDPHQDVWSRFSGGDGAPWWTLDVVGFQTDSDVIHRTGGAFLHHAFAEQCSQNSDNKDLMPQMIWPSNYGRLVTATMFTLFFAGDTFAPGIMVEEKGQQKKKKTVNDINDTENVEEESIQCFLQRHYLAYLDVVARTLKDKVNVLGFNSMNEPSPGFIGMKDLRKPLFPAPLGHLMSAFDGMRLGSGESLRRPYFSSIFMYVRHVKINEKNESIWKHPNLDIWKKVGVYEIDQKTQKRILKRPHHFSLPKQAKNKKDSFFMEEYMVPFYKNIEKVVRRHNERFVIFAESPPDLSDFKVEKAPEYLSFHSEIYAWAPHWYDLFVLNKKVYSKWIAIDIEKQAPILTPYFIRRAFQRILHKLKETGNNKLFVLLGEVGIPFDINANKSFTTNDYSDQIHALERTIHAIELNDLDYTLWNYVHDNTHEYGDLWNGENLSIRAENRNRAFQAVIRPYVSQLTLDCIIKRQEFNCFTQRYDLVVTVKKGAKFLKILVFVPKYHYRITPKITSSHGKVSHNTCCQQLVWELSNCASVDSINLSLEKEHSS